MSPESIEISRCTCIYIYTCTCIYIYISRATRDIITLLSSPMTFAMSFINATPIKFAVVNGGREKIRYAILSSGNADRSVLPFILEWILEKEWENVAKFWVEGDARLRLAEFSARRDGSSLFFAFVERGGGGGMEDNREVEGRRTVGGTREFENNHEHRIELVSCSRWRREGKGERGARSNARPRVRGLEEGGWIFLSRGGV